MRKYLSPWTMPDSYFGATWEGYFVFLGQNRDSAALDRSNFRVALEALGGESETVQVVRESHWACGWIEWIGIHKSNIAALKEALRMDRRLQDYPILSEDDFSNLEYSEAMNYWDSLSLSMKVDYCRDADVSIFAARRSYDLPDRLYESLTRS